MHNFNKMKKLLPTTRSLFVISLMVSMALVTLSCGGSEEGEKNGDGINLDEDYYTFKGINLKNHGINAMIMLPDETANIGASTKPEVIHSEGDFKWDIIVGPNFNLHIEDYGDYTDLVQNQKKILKENDVFSINYLIDEKDMILYEQKLVVKGSNKAAQSVGVEHKSYHVYGQKTIDGVTYELRSRDEGYEKVIIELMGKSIKSFKSNK